MTMHAFGNVILSNAVIVTGIALAVFVLGRVWKNRSALHLCWLLVLVKLWLPPIVTIPVPFALQRDVSLRHAAVGASSDAAPSSSNATPDTIVNAAVRQRPPVPSESQVVRGAIADEQAGSWLQKVSWLKIVASVWVLGSFALILRYGWAVLRFRRLLRFATPAPATVGAMAHAIGKQLGLRRMPEVLRVPVRLSPLVWAIGGRPRVVLPSALFERLDEAAIRSILTHEFAHIRRNDHVIRLFELLTTTCFWWHPVTWFASRRIRELEEDRCDAVVLHALPGEMKTYGIALIDTLDFLSEGPAFTPPVATTVRPAASIESRIRMLHDNVAPSQLTLVQLLLLGTLVAFPMVVAVAAKHPAAVSDADDTKKASKVPEETAEAEKQKSSLVYIYSAAVDSTDLDRLNRVVATHPLAVRGRATDHAGKPIAGAAVHLVSQGGGEASVTLATATTGADGRYEIADAKLPLRGAEMPHGQFQIYATAPGHGIAWIGQRYLDAESRAKTEGAKNRPEAPEWLYPDDPLVFDFTLGPEARIGGRLTDDAGRPIPAVQVRVTQCRLASNDEGKVIDRYLNGLKEPATTTDSDGRFVLRGLANETAATLAITHPEFGDRGLQFALTEKPDAFPKDRDRQVFRGELNLTLQRAQTIRLRLQYGETAKPLAGAEVSAWRRDKLDSFASGKSDKSGDLALLLPPGTYDLNIRPDRMNTSPGFIPTTMSLAVTDQPIDQPQVLAVPQASTLEVAVIDADTGKGIPRVSIAAETKQGGPNENLRLIIGATDGDGTFRKLVEPGR